jgi:hypothetical protein
MGKYGQSNAPFYVCSDHTKSGVRLEIRLPTLNEIQQFKEDHTRRRMQQERAQDIASHAGVAHIPSSAAHETDEVLVGRVCGVHTVKGDGGLRIAYYDLLMDAETGLSFRRHDPQEETHVATTFTLAPATEATRAGAEEDDLPSIGDNMPPLDESDLEAMLNNPHLTAAQPAAAKTEAPEMLILKGTRTRAPQRNESKRYGERIMTITPDFAQNGEAGRIEQSIRHGISSGILLDSIAQLHNERSPRVHLDGQAMSYGRYCITKQELNDQQHAKKPRFADAPAFSDTELVKEHFSQRGGRVTQEPKPRKTTRADDPYTFEARDALLQRDRNSPRQLTEADHLLLTPKPEDPGRNHDARFLQAALKKSNGKNSFEVWILTREEGLQMPRLLVVKKNFRDRVVGAAGYELLEHEGKVEAAEIVYPNRTHTSIVSHPTHAITDEKDLQRCQKIADAIAPDALIHWHRHFHSNETPTLYHLQTKPKLTDAQTVINSRDSGIGSRSA